MASCAAEADRRKLRAEVRLTLLQLAVQRMQFTCVGSSLTAWPLLREIAESPEHGLSPCGLSGDLLDRAATSGLAIPLCATEDDALRSPSVQTVIVAMEDSEACLAWSRAAVQAERDVVVLPPRGSSPALAFELHLVAEESGRSVIPVTGRWQLTELPLESTSLDMSSLSITQLMLELTIPHEHMPSSPGPTVAEPSSTLRISSSLRPLVECGLDVLSACGLPYSQVTAIDTLAPDGSLLSRLITLNSQPSAETTLPPASLTLRPARAANQGSAVSQGTVELRLIDVNGNVRGFVIDSELNRLPRVLRLVESRRLALSFLEAFATTEELAEAVDKSLRRRRTVDVHFDTGSERGVFKSLMTAIGCGVLTWMMLGLVGYLVIAGLADWPEWMLHTARVVWFAPLALFLIAQFLLPLARGRK